MGNVFRDEGGCCFFARLPPPFPFRAQLPTLQCDRTGSQVRGFVCNDTHTHAQAHGLVCSADAHSHKPLAAAGGGLMMVAPRGSFFSLSHTRGLLDPMIRIRLED